jgi:hypothetical protein
MHTNDVIGKTYLLKHTIFTYVDVGVVLEVLISALNLKGYYNYIVCVILPRHAYI